MIFLPGFCHLVATYLLYIVSGSADILVKWSLPPKKQKLSANLAPGQQQQQAAGGGQTNGAPAAAASPAGGDDFMDESETMSPIVDQESKDNRFKLLRASTKAQDFIRKLQEAAGVCSCIS
jgi:[calcium/calmodulin-dependent protein kinase] kinase